MKNKLIDLKIYSNKENLNYDYIVKGKKIIVNITDNYDEKINLDVYYDENIYDLLIDKNNIVESNIGHILLKPSSNISFEIKINDIFIVKTIYSYLNNKIDEDILINYLNLYIEVGTNKKYISSLKELVDYIVDNKKFFKIYDRLINNEAYGDVARNMSPKQIMLLITKNIAVPDPPYIDQELFDDIVKEAINYEYNKEKLWRIAMHYDSKEYNFDLIDNFFVQEKDIWYLGEYISSIWQIDQNKIVDKIIKTKDIEYIKKILSDNLLNDRLEEQCKKKLISFIGGKQNE